MRLLFRGSRVHEAPHKTLEVEPESVELESEDIDLPVEKKGACTCT